MSKEEIYPSKDGKGYIKITHNIIELPPQPKTLDDAINRIKELCEFEEDKTEMNKMIENLKKTWKDEYE